VCLSVGVCEGGGVRPPPRERVSRAVAEGRRAECVCEAESELESVMVVPTYRGDSGVFVQGRFWGLRHQIWSGWGSSVSETLRLHLPRAPSLQTRLLLLISRSPGISSSAVYCEFSQARGIVYAFSHPHLLA